MTRSTWRPRSAPRLLLSLAGRLAPGWLFSYGHRWRHGQADSGRVPFILSFDVDTEVDVDALGTVLDQLRSHRLTASFACIGEWVERRPAEHRQVLAEGHEVLNHGHTSHTELGAEGQRVSTRFYHPLTPLEIAGDIQAGHAAIHRTLGVSPVGFRAPHFATLRRHHFRSIYAALRRLGYRYSSSTTLGSTGDGLPHMEGDLVELPLMGCPHHPTSVFDSWHVCEAPDRPHRPGDLLRLVRHSLSAAQDVGSPSWINVYFDPAIAKVAREFSEVLALIAAADLEVLTLSAFATRWQAAGVAAR